MQTVKVNLNGLVVEGSVEKIVELANKLGIPYLPPNMYYSESKREWLVISEMDSLHIRNAMIKIAKQWANDLVVFNNVEIIDILEEGIVDVMFKALLAEFKVRYQ